jgi:uncharacterized SAM-binding protein YcdF (DUF218 family)
MYRFVNELLEPQRLLMLGLAAALAWLWWKRGEERRRQVLVLIPFALLWLISLPVTARAFKALFEYPYRPLATRPSEAKCIVVLSGFALPPDPRRPQPVLGEDTLYRCLHAAELYHSGPRCPVVVSGGMVDADVDMAPLAHQMRDFLLKLGVAQEDLVIEDQSTTTYENATHCRTLLAEKDFESIVLVTDALHMPRAERCFQKVGFDVTPAPCQMQSVRWECSLDELLPKASAAQGMYDVSHEMLGIIWYKLKGRIP